MRVCLKCQQSNPDAALHCQKCGGVLAFQVGSELQGRLRRYKVERVLGAGGFGVTYLVNVVPTSQRVVVKELQAQHIQDPKVRELFEREAQALAKLDPARGVPDIKDFFYSQDQRVYIVMEYIQGEPLSALINRRGQLSLSETADIALRVLNILDYLHEQGIVHRDVKPQNIMLSPNGQIKLIDFGAVKEIVTAKIEAGQITSTGIHSPGYAPPEQARGLAVNQTADLYALATTMMHMLTGVYPGELVNPQTGDFEWRHRVQVSDELARGIHKATAYQAIDRYSSAAAMRTDLQSVTAETRQALQRQQRLQTLYEGLQKAMGAEDWPTAAAKCQEIMALDQNYRDVPALWQEVQQAQARQRKLESLYNQAQDYLRRKAWHEAQAVYQQIKSLSSGWCTAQSPRIVCACALGLVTKMLPWSGESGRRSVTRSSTGRVASW